MRTDRKIGTGDAGWCGWDSFRAVAASPPGPWGLTYASRPAAEKFVRLLEAFGGDERKAATALAASKRGIQSVREVVLEHIDLLISAAEQQKAKYRNQVRDHLSDVLGATPVSAVKNRDVVAWIQRLQAKNLSPKTIANLHGLLSSAMKSAVTAGYITSNPCEGIKLPKSTRAGDTMHLLTHEEFQLLHDAMSPRYQLLLRTMVATGLRWGEITALTVADLDPSGDPRTVRVNKAWRQDGKRHFYVGSTKSLRGRRTVSLPASTAADLAAAVRGKALDDLIFVNALGNHRRPVRL